MTCNFCYETVEHVCSAKGEKKEEGKEWWPSLMAKEVGLVFVGSEYKLIESIVQEATRRARAETLREVEEKVDFVQSHYSEEIFTPVEKHALPIPPDCYSAAGARIACKFIRHEIQAMKGEVV